MTGLAALAMTANAHDVRFFASTSDTDGAMPDALPVVEPGDPIYLWASTFAPGTATKWLGFDLVLENATGEIAQNIFPGFGRWEAASDFQLDPAGAVVGVTSAGLGGGAEGGGQLYDPASGNYVFAILTASDEPVSEPTPVNLSVLAAVAQGSVEGDDAAAVGMGDLVSNDQFNADSPLTGQIATIIPEPASLMLLGLAGLAIRRR
jgi:hypothetical protein